MNKYIQAYHDLQSAHGREICNGLSSEINRYLGAGECKIVGYSKLKSGIRLMFWSGAYFVSLALVILSTTKAIAPSPVTLHAVPKLSIAM